jgi:hypothetical protein
MSLIFERIQMEGIAKLSYLIGDEGGGIAAVIRGRMWQFIFGSRASAKWRSRIFFEMDIHADLVSGARELDAQVGEEEVHASVEGRATYGVGPRRGPIRVCRACANRSSHVGPHARTHLL